MLRKEITYDHSITANNIIYTRQITTIYDGDEEISKSYHRSVIDPYTDDVEKSDHKTKFLANMLKSYSDVPWKLIVCTQGGITQY